MSTRWRPGPAKSLSRRSANALYGFPSFAATPLLLALPLALVQIWYITRIANGLKPNWNALSLSAVFLIGFTSYLLTFAFWTH